MDTFLDAYLQWTRFLEPPKAFHRWAAITAFGHALGRRVFYLHARAPIFPCSMMTLLVGPSGVKKSSAVHPAHELLLRAKTRAKDPFRIHICPDRSSNESFFDGLVPVDLDDQRANFEDTDCVGFLFAPEFSSIATGNSYQEEIPEILTDFYDKKRGVYNVTTRRLEPAYWVRYFRKDKIPVRMRNPAVTLLAGTTPTALRESLPPHVRSTGFLARVLLIYAERTDRPAYAGFEEDPADAGLGDGLAEMLAQATEMEGQARLTKEAEEIYIEWYQQERLRWTRMPEDTAPAGFARRSQDHVLRTATTLSCMNVLGHHTRGQVIPIEAPLLETAIRAVRGIEREMPLACGEMSRIVALRCEERVLNAIRRYQGTRGATWREVQNFVMDQRRDHFRVPDIIDAIERLRELRQIVMLEDQKAHRQARYKLRVPRPNPWIGTPAQHPPSDEYLAEQDEMLLQEEIEAGLRDRDGKTIH